MRVFPAMRASDWGVIVALLGALLTILGCGQADPAEMPTIHAARERVSGPTAAVASLHAGEKLSLDTGGQVHPVLLDAPNETVVWEQADQDLPTAREAHALAFDSARGKVVLFGGRGTDLKDRNDTWEWDGNAWKELHPT